MPEQAFARRQGGLTEAVVDCDGGHQLQSNNNQDKL